MTFKKPATSSGRPVPWSASSVPLVAAKLVSSTSGASLPLVPRPWAANPSQSQSSNLVFQRHTAPDARSIPFPPGAGRLPDSLRGLASTEPDTDLDLHQQITLIGLPAQLAAQLGKFQPSPQAQRPQASPQSWLRLR